MTSSEEEGEILPDWVTDYEFVNQQNQHVSFACLPVVHCKNEVVDNTNLRIFLSASCNDGLERFYKQVVAWRYDLSYRQPEISVLCKGNHWIKILNPKKQFKAVVGSILITIQSLHFVKRNPEASDESLQRHLARAFRCISCKVSYTFGELHCNSSIELHILGKVISLCTCCSTFEVAPSEADFMSHIPLIRDAAEHDNDIACSKYILWILLEHPEGKTLNMVGLPLKRAEFIVDDVVDDSSDLEELCNEDDELFDTCCSICDNGGDILCCEGRCMRSFHATETSGEGLCKSLCLSEAQINALPNFFCENCQYQQHQCLICGVLGSSDISSNPEVFPCVAANCGRFYHPKCVAEELQKRNGGLVEALEQKIAGGESFACPAHRCFVCKQVEDRKIKDMQFAACRRCPKSYHRKCLPREIAFEADYEKNILQRAWDNLLPKRILIYCLDHEIRPDLGTPERNHLCFPGSDKEKKAALATTTNVAQRKRKLMASQSSAEDVVQYTPKQDEKFDFSAGLVGKSPCRPGLDSHRKRSSSNSASVSMVHEKISQKAYGSSTLTGGKKMHDNSKLSHERSLKQYSQKPGNVGISCKKLNTAGLVNRDCSSPVSDPEMEKRIIALMKDVDSSFDVDEFIKKQKVPSMYKNSQDMLDKTVTMGKVEVAVKAVQTALQKLKNGGTVDGAKAVCSPEMLCQIPLWKRKLGIYLGPFLHGMRYSSYGRHFTNLEKLQEIVDRLHWYVQDGDMIVDFCCGANDFSRLMKAKLDSVGKKNCSFKNYDLFPTKNDFNFEQRDWFTVTPGELPRGPQLIMGLNPPFGVKGVLANKFIDHALQFDPKLIILIVPPETQRLDRRRDGKNYDLIWEDRCLLSGKSFYLPGSIDMHDKHVLQWNNTAPCLSLWSRPKWTTKNRTIARRQHPCLLPGHLPLSTRTSTWNYLMSDQHDCYNDFFNFMNEGGDLNCMLDDVPEPNDECIPGRGKQLR